MKRAEDPRMVFDGHPLECRRHPGRARMSCVHCFRDGSKVATDRGRAVVRAARSLLGVPFAHLGRSRHGVDCLGVGLLARNEAGIPTNYQKPYRQDLEDVDVEGEARRLFECSDDLDAATAGDVVLFRFPSRGWSHFAVLTDDGTIVLASPPAPRGRGIVIEHACDYRWAGRAVLRVPVGGA